MSLLKIPSIPLSGKCSYPDTLYSPINHLKDAHMPKIAPVPIMMPRIAFNFGQLSNNSLIRFCSVICSAAASCNPYTQAT